MRNETKYKECEGCRGCGSYHIEGDARILILRPYYINEQGNKIECPCQTCLIKGICKDPCDDVQVYYNFHNIAKNKKPYRGK